MCDKVACERWCVTKAVCDQVVCDQVVCDRWCVKDGVCGRLCVVKLSGTNGV